MTLNTCKVCCLESSARINPRTVSLMIQIPSQNCLDLCCNKFRNLSLQSKLTGCISKMRKIRRVWLARREWVIAKAWPISAREERKVSPGKNIKSPELEVENVLFYFQTEIKISREKEENFLTNFCLIFASGAISFQFSLIQRNFDLFRFFLFFSQIFPFFLSGESQVSPFCL